MPSAMPNSADRPRLLFTGGGGAAAEALHRLLSEHYDVHLADADPEAKPAFVSDSFWHNIPFASAPDFVAKLRQLCSDLGIDVVIPGVDEELLLISEARLSLGCEVLLPSTRFIQAHLDKFTSNALLKSFGVPVPETHTCRDDRVLNFPCIIKPRTGRGSRDVATVRSEQELQAHLVRSRRPSDDFIVQELLQGQEYTVTMVADRAGVLRAVVPVKVEIKRGITLRGETHRDDEVMAACASIHAADPIAGCFNIQLIKTATGAVRVFEVNPRISTTTCLALAAGVDFIGLYLGTDRASDRQPSGLAAFRDHFRLKRSWYNEFLPAAGES